MVTLTPEQKGRVLINGREITEATPVSLLRKANAAAVLTFRMPRKTYLSLHDVEREVRQGSIVQLYYGAGASGTRIFYGYIPSIAADKPISETDEIRIVAYDFVGQLEDAIIELSTVADVSTVILPSGSGVAGSGGSSGGGGSGGGGSGGGGTVRF